MAAGSLQTVSRTVTFLPGLGLAAYGWYALGQPLALAGLGVLFAVALITWPALVLAAVCFANPSVLAGMLVTRRRRSRYRQHLIERGVPREAQRSSRISKRLRQVTFAADRHRCAGCGARHVRLEWDHIIPWAGGGLTVLWNGAALCTPCNGIKSNYSRDKDGYEHYAGSRRDIYQARKILARERRRRLNPLRFPRAAWALAS
jgi:5-methylcytosine-specific restriction endonuclease McrA